MRVVLRTGLLAVLGSSLGVLLAGACSANDNNGGDGQGLSGGAGGSESGTGGASGGSGGTSGTDASSGGGVNLDGSFNDAITADAACDLQKFKATITKKPVDVVFVVDNSCSMIEESQGIEQNINQNFAQIIQSSGIDYRVVMIAEHGPYSPDSSICVGSPLGGAPCATPVPVNTPPINNPPLYYHYDHNDVESWDAWCKMLDWYDKPDRWGLMPGGWKAVLRPEAFKIIVAFSDDSISCSLGTFDYDDQNTAAGALTAATQFDADITSLDTAQFGTVAERNYRYYAIVGVAPNPAGPTQPYAPTDPITMADCPSAVNTGPGHQGLAILTGGLRFPVCDGTGYDVVFQEIAAGVIEGAKIVCEFPMPDPPAGKELDPATITIEYTASATGDLTKFKQVADASKCEPNAFYIDGDTLKLCDDACSLVQADNQAEIDILALCKSGVSK
jgi:hypothetical protein